MDPFQTRCNLIEPWIIDSPSVMLFNRSDKTFKSQSGELISDVLILINPSTPNLSLTLFRSLPYQYLNSIMLCRDLYMYSPKMPFSTHSHAFLKACSNQSRAYIELSMKILYSMRKIWGNYSIQKEGVENENINLFKRWYSWNTLTQKESDNCAHPVQLLLMMGVYDVESFDCDLDLFDIPLDNLMNEFMARKMKIKFSN